MLKVLTDIYRCRNRRTFILNASYGVKLTYIFVKTFLKETTTRKFFLTNENTCEELLAMVHPSQLEEKFGGEAENAT